MCRKEKQGDEFLSNTLNYNKSTWYKRQSFKDWNIWLNIIRTPNLGKLGPSLLAHSRKSYQPIFRELDCCCWWWWRPRTRWRNSDRFFFATVTLYLHTECPVCGHWSRWQKQGQRSDSSFHWFTYCTQSIQNSLCRGPMGPSVLALAPPSNVPFTHWTRSTRPTRPDSSWQSHY